MAGMRRFELEDLVNRPGTYLNPQLEVVLVVDDSADIDHETFAAEEFEGSDDWVLVSDEAPVDEQARDELLERFQARHAPAAAGVLEEDDGEDEEDELEPDPDPDEL
jgi:hypothetical protein